MANDNTQHGIDNNTSNDAEKGAALGGLGGAAVGAAAGSLAGPVGTIIGAVAGGLMGAGASGAAVAAVDAVDNDNTVSGVGDGNTRGAGYSSDNVRASSDEPVIDTGVGGHNVVTGGPARTEAGNTGLAAGALTGGLIGTALGGPVGAVIGGALGSVTGGVAGDATEAADDNASLAADTNYSGSAFQANAMNNPDVTTPPAGYTQANDDVISPSTQTDYRSVDNGLAGVGATDTNADVAPLGGYSSPVGAPGVGTGSDAAGLRSDTNIGGSDTRGSIGGGSDTRGVLNDGNDIGTDAADTTTLGSNNSTIGQSSSDVGGGTVR